MGEPIIVPNEGEQRTEYAVEWTFAGGHRTYTLGSLSRAQCEERIAKQKRPGVKGQVVQCTVTRAPWVPVLPPGVLRLDQIRAEEYGGIKVAELGDGAVEGYNVVAFTDDPQRAFAAVRAHFAMAHNGEMPQLSPRWEDDPVRWWQVYDTCGCGDTCPHAADEDHDCVRWGLPPCRWEEDVASWIGEVCEKDTPGALPFVEFEVGDSYTPDERVTVLRSLLTDAERRLRKLAKTCLVVKTSLDKPYGDKPDTTPWKQHVERPTRDAYNLAQEIRRELKASGAAS